jgi:glycine cleavage system H protein
MRISAMAVFILFALPRTRCGCKKRTNHTNFFRRRIMNIPAELKFSKSHEWVRLEGDEAVIGITEFAQEQLGDLTFIELPAAGDTLTAGEEMGSVESVKAASELYAPVSGEVTEVNLHLEDAPEAVNESPYDKGWMLKIKVSAVADSLLSAEEYAALIESEAH